MDLRTLRKDWAEGMDQDWVEVQVEVIRDIIRDQDQNIDLGLKAVKCPYIEGFQKEDFQIFYLKKNSR